MNNSRITIGMLWHTFASGNQGVNALTVSNTAIARSVAEQMGLEPQFVYFAPGTETVIERTANGDRIIRINRATMLTSLVFWTSLAELDCMLDITAGDSFAEIYGAKRFFLVWLTKWMTLARKIPLLLSPQTIGPFTRQPYRYLAAGIMERAALTVARDPQSLAAIEELAPGANKLLSADVAFRLPFEARDRATDGKVHVGVNVSGLLWHQSVTGANGFGLGYDYRAMTVQLLDKLVARDDIVVHLITHVVDSTSPDDSDGPAIDLLADRYPVMVRVPDFAGPSDAKSYIACLDVMIGARMHACIAAFSTGVAVIPVAYSRKFIGLFGDLLQYPHSVAPQGYDADTTVAFILDRIERRIELREAVKAGNERIAPLLDAYEKSLAELFGARGRRLKR